MVSKCMFFYGYVPVVNLLNSGEVLQSVRSNGNYGDALFDLLCWWETVYVIM